MFAGLRKRSGSKQEIGLSLYIVIKVASISRFLVALVLFVGVNAAVAASPLGRTVVQPISLEDFKLTETVKAEGKPSSWWLARAFRESEERPDVVVCGSSQIGGLQASDANITGKPVDFVSNHHCPTIEQALVLKSYVFLSALPGAMISDHFAIAKALYEDRSAPPIVVLTISPRDFLDNSLPCAGATEPYKYFSKFSDMTAYTGLAYNQPWSRLEHFTGSEMPMRKLEPYINYLTNKTVNDLVPAAEIAGTADGAKNTKVADASAQIQAQLKFVMGGYEGNIRPGQAVLTPNLPQIYVDNTRDYKRRYKNTHPPVYDVQMQYLKECLSYLDKKGTKVLIVGMPLTQSNRELLNTDFWNRYRADILVSTAPTGAKFLDLIEDATFNQKDFCDTVHLNASGGKKLAEKMAAFILQDKAYYQALRSGKSGIAAGSTSWQ